MTTIEKPKSVTAYTPWGPMAIPVDQLVTLQSAPVTTLVWQTPDGLIHRLYGAAVEVVHELSAIVAPDLRTVPPR